MSEFTVRKTRHGKWGVYMPNGAILTSFISEQKAKNHANYLNEGNAPLHARVTEPAIEQKINDFAKISVELQGEAMKPLQERIVELETELAKAREALRWIATSSTDAVTWFAQEVLDNLNNPSISNDEIAKKYWLAQQSQPESDGTAERKVVQQLKRHFDYWENEAFASWKKDAKDGEGDES